MLQVILLIHPYLFQVHFLTNLFHNSITDVTAKKKLTISMAKTMQSKFASQKSTLNFNDNYFMPKRTIQRPDGATLTEVYQSKRADTWASILKAQLRDEEEEKIVKRQEKLKADEDFGKKLKAQLDDNHRRFLSTLGTNPLAQLAYLFTNSFIQVLMINLLK